MTSLIWHAKQVLRGGVTEIFIFEGLFFWCKILNFFELCQKSFILDRFWVICKNHPDFITSSQYRLIGTLPYKISLILDRFWVILKNHWDISSLWILRQKSLKSFVLKELLHEKSLTLNRFWVILRITQTSILSIWRQNH